MHVQNVLVLLKEELPLRIINTIPSRSNMFRSQQACFVEFGKYFEVSNDQI